MLGDVQLARPVKVRKRILHYLKENPESTASEIAEGLYVNYKTIAGALSVLERKGKIEATDSWPRRFSVAGG